MSDIFISYSKADHALAMKLSTFLAAEGWSVWWDKNLGAADLYRDEIMKQLAAARAVITIWTKNSIKSDWVRAEAGRAKADGKLIPVKTPDVAYADIPLPFGEMHTENVGSPDLIKGAIVALLAKPQPSAAPFWRLTGLLKYELLTWIGIIGSSITVFANLKGVLDLADWARALVSYWHEWMYVFWKWILAWVAIEVPKEIATQLSFMMFTVMLVLASNRSGAFAIRSTGTPNTLSVRKRVRLLVDGVFVYLMFSALATFVGEFLVFIALGIPIIWLYVTCDAEERGLVMIASLLFIVVGICLLVVPLFVFGDAFTEKSGKNVGFFPVEGGRRPGSNRLIDEQGDSMGYAFFAILFLFQTCWMGAVLFSPLSQLTRRLSFVVVAVITLASLSEISKFNLHKHLHPPMVSDNSVQQPFKIDQGSAEPTLELNERRRRGIS